MDVFTKIHGKIPNNGIIKAEGQNTMANKVGTEPNPDISDVTDQEIIFVLKNPNYWSQAQWRKIDILRELNATSRILSVNLCEGIAEGESEDSDEYLNMVKDVRAQTDAHFKKAKEEMERLNRIQSKYLHVQDAIQKAQLDESSLSMLHSLYRKGMTYQQYALQINRDKSVLTRRKQTAFKKIRDAYKRGQNKQGY